MSVFHPYIDMSLGDFVITPNGDPHYVTDFTVKRLLGTGGDEVSFTVYDHTAQKFEFALLNGQRNITGSYGMAPESSRMAFNLELLSWKMSFDKVGCRLSVNSINKGNVTKDSTKLEDEYPGPPIAIIKEVVRVCEWGIGELVDMEEIHLRELPTSLLGENKDIPTVFPRKNLSALSFINTLLPYCRAKDGNTSMITAYLRYDEDAKKDLFYCHPVRGKLKSSSDHTFNVGNKESNVKSFDIKTDLFPFRRGSSIKVLYQDSDGNLHSAVSGGVEKIPEKVRKYLTLQEWQEQTHIVRVASQEEAQVIADYMWSLKLFAPIEVTMQVIDYNKPINIQDQVTVQVYVGSPSVSHYSSGTYFVVSVTDSIKGGHLYTDLVLSSLFV